MKSPFTFIIAILIILGIFWYAFQKTKVPPPDNFTVSKMCPDGFSPKEYTSADGKKTKTMECPVAPVEPVEKWPCDLETMKCP